MSKDAYNAERLQRTLDVCAIVPIIPKDSVIVTLSFRGGGVLCSLGALAKAVL